MGWFCGFFWLEYFVCYFVFRVYLVAFGLVVGYLVCLVERGCLMFDWFCACGLFVSLEF